MCDREVEGGDDEDIESSGRTRFHGFSFFHRFRLIVKKLGGPSLAILDDNQ